MKPARDGYSTSKLDLEIVLCILDFQNMRDFPKMIANPIVDRRVDEQVAQSLSVKLESVKSKVVR